MNEMLGHSSLIHPHQSILFMYFDYLTMKRIDKSVQKVCLLARLWYLSCPFESTNREMIRRVHVDHLQ